MSSLFTNGPATRLCCRACRRMSSMTPRSSSIAAMSLEPSPKRQYATKVIVPQSHSSPKKSPTAAASMAPSSRKPGLSARGRPDAIADSEPERFIFSRKDVPSLAQFTVTLDSLGVDQFTPMECMEASLRYVSIATQKESLWRGKLLKEHDLSPYKLHWIGTMLLSMDSFKLGAHMLRSASELGYSPSTLTLVRVFRDLPAKVFRERIAQTNMFMSADARFKEILDEGTDPDAFTLQGMIQAKQGNSKKALLNFRRAEQAWQKAKIPDHKSEGRSDGQETDARQKDAGEAEVFTLPKPREPRWEWEISCVVGQADALKAQGEVHEAERLYRVAALELDNAKGFLELSKLMGGPRDGAERRTYLLKAAISGEIEACRELGALEQLDATRKGISAAERQHHQHMGREWLRLAEGEELTSVKPEDVDDARAAG